MVTFLIVLYILFGILCGVLHRTAQKQMYGKGSYLLQGEVSIVIAFVWPLAVLVGACELVSDCLIDKV